MHQKLQLCELRSWRILDAPSLAKYANNRKIWLNLRDAFPYPYSLEDAQRFIKTARAQVPEAMFAICVKDKAVGSIGIGLHSDVERVSAEIGYWLGEPFWNKGITTEALSFLTKYAIDKYKLTRVYAVPYEWNDASFRVLEKSGYKLESRMRKSVIKDGKIIDQLLYAYVP